MAANPLIHQQSVQQDVFAPYSVLINTTFYQDITESLYDIITGKRLNRKSILYG